VAQGGAERGGRARVGWEAGCLCVVGLCQDNTYKALRLLENETRTNFSAFRGTHGTCESDIRDFFLAKTCLVLQPILAKSHWETRLTVNTGV
jgi:hypothetical protein